MILVKNITSGTEMKVISTTEEFVRSMNSKPNCKILLSQTGKYLMNLNGVFMRLDIKEL